jgi:putative phage-type endonuclease
MEAVKLLEIAEDNRQEWLRLRRSGIGSSDIAAVAGLSKYRSALSVYLDKISDTSEEIENEHIEFGNWMEPIIRAEFPRRYLKKEGVEILVDAFPYLLQHPEKPFMLFSPDGAMIHPVMEWGGIEIKTAGERQWKEWMEDNLPDEYYCQLQWGMGVTGWQYFYIVALVGKRLVWKLVPRNQDIIDKLIEIGQNFWLNNVLRGEPPMPDGSKDAERVLKALYPTEDGQVIELHGLLPEYETYKTLTQEIKDKEKRLSEIKQKIMAQMGTAEVALIGDRKATWKTVEKKEYMVKASSSRVFRIY